MATNELQAKITADISGLESGLKKAEKLQRDYGKSISNTQKDIAQNIAISRQYEKAIDDLNRELRDGSVSQKDYSKRLQRLQRDEKETQVETANLRKELARLKRDQKDLTASTGGISTGLNGVKKSATNVTPTLLEFNRTIQDAPFGIQGVANNIQQLTANFGNLQKSAGGTIPALKALASGFIGPQGILFAVSAITAGLVAYQNGVFDSANSTKALREEAEKNKEALDDYIDSLKGVDRATLDSQKSSAEELITLRALRSQIENTALSTEEREDGIVKLRKQFPAYFQDIENEKLLNGQAATAYDVLTNSIVKRARATAALDLLVENAKAEFDASRRLLQIEDELKEVQAAKIKSKQEELRLNESIGANRGVTTGTQLTQQIKTANLVEKENDLIEERLRLFQQIGSAQLDNIDLQKQVTENVIVEPTVRDSSALKKQAEKASNLLLKIDKQLFSEKEKLALESANDIVNQVNKIYESSGAKDADALGLQNIIEDANATEAPILALENRIKSFSDTLKTLGLDKDSFDISGLDTTQITAFENQLKSTMSQVELFSNAVNAGFSTLGNQISEAIIEGKLSLITFKDVAGAVVSSVIQSLAQLAAQFITNFIAQKALSKLVIGAEQTKANASGIAIAASAASGLGPIGIGALPGLIATTLAGINAAYAPLYAFAGGGIVPGGSFNGDRVPALLNSGEMILNSGQQKNLFDILNNNLASLQGRSSDSNQGTTVSVLRGEDIYLMYERQKRKNIRFNGS